MKARWFNIVVLLTLLAGIMPLAVLAAPSTEDGGIPTGKSKYQFEAVEATPIKMDEAAIYIIQLEAAPAASYRGEIAGLAATNPRVKGEVKLDTQSAASIAYVNYLQDQQAQFINALEESVTRPVEVKYQYQYVLNGMAVWLTPQEAADIAKLPGVVNVERDYMLYPTTDIGPEWIGAPGIWDGTDTGGLPGTQGEGILVGVLDTGINMDHPSFASTGDDGYTVINPLGADNYIGLCDTEPTTYTCTSKLIGVWDYIPEDGIDGDHGSHTASTTAGNVVYSPTIKAATITITAVKISGVAPHANIIMYDVCNEDGCPNSATTAAKEQAILDGVDVINYSIGGGGANPWTDSGALGWLNVRDAGIFVATSAGNTGPGAETMGSPGNSPWMLTVGASTHNRKFRNALIDMTGGTAAPADIEGKSITSGYGPAEIVYAGWYTSTGSANDAKCLKPFAPGTFSGEIVVCDRGVAGRVEKGDNVLAGGAGGYVLANDQANALSLNADAHALPAVHISYSAGVTLKTWLTSTVVQQATIAGTTLAVNDDYADIMAGFSSRGPNNTAAAAGIIKPDVVAPGVDIFAATVSGIEYQLMGGTSMASPHAAGAGALILALHPTWTPAEVQSALMMTAWTDILKEDEATAADPFDRGAGRVDLSKAGTAGLVLDETTANFTAADPATGGDPQTLNLASFGNGLCLQQCSWTRTLSNTKSYTVTWTAAVTGATGMTTTVTPNSFELAPNSTQVITVETDVSALPNDIWVFGQVTLEPTTAFTVPAQAHFPLAVKPSTGVLPALVEINTRRNAGSQLIEDLQALEITDLTIDTFGFTLATLTHKSLSEDTAHDSPYDNLTDGVFYITTTVGADAQRLVAELTASEAPDLDMFVGRDLDGDGPEKSEQVCKSATGSWAEYCDITGSDLVTGTWWILVQNWDGSGSQPDDVTLATAVVAADSGNMTVTGPTTVPEKTDFALRLYWDTPTIQAGDLWYGAFSIGTDGASHGNIGTVPVNLTRYADDVIKSVSPAIAKPGDTVTYTIDIQPNITGHEVTYSITDTIPAGLTYVPGSASADSGTVSVVGDVLTWDGTLIDKGFYRMTTSNNDPYCDTGFGGYVNLEAFGISPKDNISGEGAWSAFSGQNPMQFYDVDKKGINFNDDGLAYFDTTMGANPEVNTALPDPTAPNDLMAILWSNMKIIYDGTAGGLRGVSLASAGPEISIIEYDDMEPVGGGTDRYDFEVVINSTINNTPGFYEFVYAYDNIIGQPHPVTVGVENQDGILGNEFVYTAGISTPTTVITDGLMVCFDYTLPKATITYQATVDATSNLATLTNIVQHNTDDPGSKEASTSAELAVIPYTWNKVVTVNGAAYTQGHLLANGDQIQIVDSVWITNTIAISHALTETWNTSSFALKDYQASTGSVVTGTGSLTWSGSSMNTWAVLTKTFTVQSGAWTVDQIDETLSIDDHTVPSRSTIFGHLRYIYLPLVMRGS
ncbi:MAG: S8 family serine peptidase [Anaerolineae bacterium]|nr:S8 family serine peptidase [Anaerolineae bacterium]